MVSSTLLGFVLLITSATAEPMPVTETIYSSQSSCEQIKMRLLERRPNAQLECSPVIDGRESGFFTPEHHE